MPALEVGQPYVKGKTQWPETAEYTYRRGQRTGIPNDQGIGWVDSEGPFSLDGSNDDGSLEGCTPAGGCHRAMNRRNDNEPYSFHPGGAHFLFADGHVQFLAEQMELLTLAALCTRAAHEVVNLVGP